MKYENRYRNNLSGHEDGVSGLQAILVLLCVVLLLALVIKLTVGDSIISAAARLTNFHVWGTDNEMNAPQADRLGVTITSPVDGSTCYIDQRIPIEGDAFADSGRKVVIVNYRLNAGEWKKAGISGDHWYGETTRFPQGDNRIEAVAYDNAGVESGHAYSSFSTLFRLYPDAILVSDNLPTTMIAGEQYSCAITFQNTGNVDWYQSEQYRLSPCTGNAFGASYFELPQSRVIPSEMITFNLLLTAPDTPGTSTVSYRMNARDYGWFGDELNKQITVVPATLDAKLVSIDLPSEMNEGDTYEARITYRNAGTGTWYATGSHHVDIGVADGDSGDACDFTGWNKRALPSSTTISPGTEYTFQFTITAPAPGSYDLRFKMLSNDNAWFGEEGARMVKVNARPVTPTVTPPVTPPEEPEEPPYMAYVAWGPMAVYDPSYNRIYGGPYPWKYTGPLCRDNCRGTYSFPGSDHDWEIGGPDGDYYISGDSGFEVVGGTFHFRMGNGGNKGTLVLRKTF